MRHQPGLLDCGGFVSTIGGQGKCAAEGRQRDATPRETYQQATAKDTQALSIRMDVFGFLVTLRLEDEEKIGSETVDGVGARLQ